MNKMAGWIGLWLVVSLVLSACGGAPASQDASVVRIGWAGSPDTLNPGAALLSESFVIFELVYSSLVDLQLDGTYTPDLAESWTTSEDGTIWTFKIREGVKFSDGAPLTARDVVFTYQFYQQHEEFPFMNGYTSAFDTVTAPDDQTVVLNLNSPAPSLESQIVFLYILPEHIWKDHSQGAAASEFENLQMIGSGPFSMKEYRQGEYVQLAANKEFYLSPPKVDGVVFQTFSNLDALVQAIKTGQVDMITEMPNTAVATLQGAENVAVVTGPPLAPDVTDIIFNVTEQADCPEDGICSGHPALRDKTVRQALAHATNKQELVDIVLLGLGTPGLTLIPDSLGVWYNQTIQDFPFDLAIANQMLDDAGYADTDGDGVREMPGGGQPLVFRLNWPSDSTVAPRLAELLSKTWIQAGVQLQLQALDPDALSSICCPAFDYDVIIWGWGSDPDPSFLLSVMTSYEIPTGMSETGYNNPQYDSLFDEQNITMDPDQRKDIIWRMQEIVHDDAIYIIPFYSKAVQAYRTDRFTGWITDQPKLALEDVTSLVRVEPVK